MCVPCRAPIYSLSCSLSSYMINCQNLTIADRFANQTALLVLSAQNKLILANILSNFQVTINTRYGCGLRRSDGERAGRKYSLRLEKHIQCISSRCFRTRGDNRLVSFPNHRQSHQWVTLVIVCLFSTYTYHAYISMVSKLVYIQQVWVRGDYGGTLWE